MLQLRHHKVEGNQAQDQQSQRRLPHETAYEFAASLGLEALNPVPNVLGKLLKSSPDAVSAPSNFNTANFNTANFNTANFNTGTSNEPSAATWSGRLKVPTGLIEDIRRELNPDKRYAALELTLGLPSTTDFGIQQSPRPSLDLSDLKAAPKDEKEELNPFSKSPPLQLITSNKFVDNTNIIKPAPERGQKNPALDGLRNARYSTV